MSVGAGEEIEWHGETYQVLVVRPLSAELLNQDGDRIEIAIDELQRFASAVDRAGVRGIITTRRTDKAEDTGVDVRIAAFDRIAEAPRGERKAAIAAEAERLSDLLGRPVSTRTLERWLAAYQRDGRAGLLDGRAGDARTRRTPSADPRVVEAINTVLAGRSRSSTLSKTVVIEQVARVVAKTYGDAVVLPSRATLFRILDEEDRGRHSFGSAKTRETTSLQPDRAFGRRAALRPGEQVQIDTTRLDVMVRIDDGTIGRPELTIMLDVATRSILAAVLRPEGTKSIDLVIVLARALVPYERRPDGARETRQLMSTAWAEDCLIEQDRFERLRLAQPFIFPETITTDRGRTYLSRHFRAACETLGISLVTAAPHTPTDKPHVERTFESIASLFLQYVKGYVGRSVEYRGRDVESQSEHLITIGQMQELLEDWIAVEWQNRSHDSLRDPLHPTIMLSPNEMCRAFRHVVPELHVPLAREDFISLLPVIDRRINQYGVTINHRVYDSRRLGEYRRRVSPRKSKQGRWPIRVDPYNLHTVWLEADGEFIPLHWNNDVHELPMLGDVWRLARTARWEQGEPETVDAELVAAMRTFAGQGNPSRTPKQKARAKAVAADPMNPTSAAVLDPAAVPAVPVGEHDEEETWPHRGGFAFIGDDLDEIRERLED